MAIFNAEYKLAGKRVILRNPEPEDAAEGIALLKQLDTETTFLMREPGEFSMTLEQEREFLLARKESENSIMIFAEIEGKIVGSSMAVIGGRKRVRHKADIGISILKAYWGMGIGKTLMTELLSWLKKQGVKKVCLEVDTRNLRAISLYMRFGFSVEGTQIAQRILADGTVCDSYWMGLFLE